MLDEELVDLLDLLVLLDVLALLDVELVLDGLEVVDALDVFGTFGVKLLFPVPKPSAVASLPLPSTVTRSLVFLAVMVRCPLGLSDAVTNAGPELMALMTLATVSAPVDV